MLACYFMLFNFFSFEPRGPGPGTKLPLGLLEYLNQLIMDSSCIDCQQPLHHIKMSSHPAILSIRDAFLKTDLAAKVKFPDSVKTKEIEEDALVTFDDVEKANNAAVAVRGHFGERRRASGYRDGTNICV